LTGLFAVYELAMVCRCGLSIILLVTNRHSAHLQVGWFHSAGCWCRM